jgi:regulator of protease activity HflC (stomatin/prohibitin superfamily)
LPTARYSKVLSYYEHLLGDGTMNKSIGTLVASVFFLGFCGLIGLWTVYSWFRIDVPSKHIAVLIKKTGIDLENNQEVAPDDKHKGIQKDVLAEGRYFYNPYNWDWEVIEMVEVPTGQLGVRVRFIGDDLPYGETIAWQPNQKGIVPEVLRPGRYAINPHVERVDYHEPITVPAGYQGVVTLLAAPMPDNPNVLLVDDGKRGVQATALPPGTYYVNPYVTRINLVDCRSQRFNLGEASDMGFPSKDGFWVELDGIIEFRVKPDNASNVFVSYNDSSNDVNGERVDEEIINKIILPNARSFCRLRGSNNAGRDFISGDTRIQFQNEFQEAMRKACDQLGVEIIQALITRIKPPEAIADPIRNREVAQQTLDQYKHQIEQFQSEKKLAIEQALVTRNQELVEADRKVVVMTLKAQEDQNVAVTQANENLEVAKLRLDAAKDEAAAILARGAAEADVIEFNNQAEAAGWKRAVEAFGGNGHEFARYTMHRKLAPGYRNIMANTKDSPIMDIFKEYRQQQPALSPTRPISGQ